MGICVLAPPMISMVRTACAIEGIAAGGVLHKVQKAWVEYEVPQCGYCQAGMIMAVVALLRDKPAPTDASSTRSP